MKSTTEEEQEREFIQLIRNADSVKSKSIKAMIQAFNAGADERTAIEAGSAVLVEAGRDPLPVDNILAKLKEAETA